MPRLTLSLAIGDYGHVSDLASGRVPVEGAERVVSQLPGEEIFHRFLAHREWDVAEISIGKHVAMIAAGGDSITALPVLPSRAFRHSMFSTCAPTAASAASPTSPAAPSACPNGRRPPASTGAAS